MSIKDLRPSNKIQENQLKFGEFFKEDLEDGIWNRKQVYENLNRFISGDFGDASEDAKKLNDENIRAEKGGILGIYNKGDNKMIVYYDPSYDESSIYILNDDDFNNVPKSWEGTEEEYIDKYATKSKKKYANEKRVRTSPTFLYKEKGHTLTRQQKEYLKEKNPTSVNKETLDKKEALEKELKELNEELEKLTLNPNKATAEEYKKVWNLRKHKDELVNEIKKLDELIRSRGSNLIMAHEPVSAPSAAYATNEDIETVKKSIKTGVNEDGKEIKRWEATWEKDLMNVAQALGVSYDEIVERFAEMVMNKAFNYTYSDAYEYIMRNAKKPYFLSDDVGEIDKMKKDATPERKVEYMNDDTGEVTDSHDEAVQWFRDGDEVIVYLNGEEKTRWVHESRLEESDFTIIDDAIANSEKVAGYLDGKIWLWDAIEDVINVLNEDMKGFIGDNEKSVTRYIRDKLLRLEKVRKFNDSKPDWLDDEVIDDIVYDKEWPVSVKDVAKALVKKGVRSHDSAIKYVHDYIKNNPSERKHFKDEDLNEFKTHTHQGYEVVSIYENDAGRKFVIGYRKSRNDYFVGTGYDTSDGIWAQGYYDFASEKEAADFLYDRYGYQNLEVIYHK